MFMLPARRTLLKWLLHAPDRAWVLGWTHLIMLCGRLNQIKINIKPIGFQEYPCKARNAFFRL